MNLIQGNISQCENITAGPRYQTKAVKNLMSALNIFTDWVKGLDKNSLRGSIPFLFPLQEQDAKLV
jgi:hypothetical protein